MSKIQEGNKFSISEKMKEVCEENGFEPTRHFDKIVRAKENFFGYIEWWKCPCDVKNPERFCISPLCKKDIEEKGYCHCNCYQKRH